MISNETSSWWQWQSDYKPEKRTSVLTVAPDLEGVILKYFQELKTWDTLGIAPIWGVRGPLKYRVGYWWIRTAPGGTHRVTNRQSHWPDLQRLQPASAPNMHFFSLLRVLIAFPFLPPCCLCTRPLRLNSMPKTRRHHSSQHWSIKCWMPPPLPTPLGIFRKPMMVSNWYRGQT